MKILILILAISGGALSWMSKPIAGYIWKNKEVKEQQNIYVKLAGLALVILAVIATSL